MSKSEWAGGSKQGSTRPTDEPRTGEAHACDTARSELDAVRARLDGGREDRLGPDLNASAAAAMRGANRVLGNFAAGQAMAAARIRRPSTSAARRSTVQAKLLVGSETDPLEREADELADMLVRARGFATPPGDDASAIRPAFAWRSSAAVHQPFGVDVPDALTREIEGLENGGQPLSGSERAFFEPRLGVDLAHVRVHADARAAELCTTLQARAFTHGRHIVLGAHAYAPGTADARRLMAHELVHVLQQGGAAPPVAQSGPQVTGLDSPPIQITRAPASIVSRETFYLGETQDILVGVEVKNGIRYAHIMRRSERGGWVGVTEVVIPNNEDPKKVALIAVNVTKTHPNKKPGQSADLKIYDTGGVERKEYKKEELGDAYYDIDVMVPAGFVVHHNQQPNQRVKHVSKSVEDIEKEQKAEQAERSEVLAFVEQQYKKDMLERMKLYDPFGYRSRFPFGPDGLPLLSDYDNDQISLQVDRKAARSAVINSPEFQNYKLLKLASDKKFEWINNMLEAEKAKGTPISVQEAERRLKAVLALARADRKAQEKGGDASGVVPKQEDDRPLTEQVAELLRVKQQEKDWNAKNEADARLKAAQSLGPTQADAPVTADMRAMADYLGQELPGDSARVKQLKHMVRDNAADLPTFAAQQLDFAVMADPNGAEAQYWRSVLTGRRLSLDAIHAEKWTPGIEERKRKEEEQLEEQKERARIIARLSVFSDLPMLNQLTTAELKEQDRKIRWDRKPNREAMIARLSTYLDLHADRQAFRDAIERNKVTDQELWEQLGKLGLDRVLSPTEQDLKRKYGSLPREKTNEKGDLVGYELTEVKEEAMGGRLRVTIRTIDPQSGSETKSVKVILTPAAEFWAQTGDFAIGFIPYVGVAKALFEAISGKSLSFHDAAMGNGLRDMTPGERIEAALGAVPGHKGFPNLAKLGAVVGRVSQVKMAIEVASGYSFSGKDIDLLLAGKPPRKLKREELVEKAVMGGLGHVVSKLKGKFEEIHEANLARDHFVGTGGVPDHVLVAEAAAMAKGFSPKKAAADKGDLPDGVYLARDAEHYDLALAHPQEKAELHLELMQGQHGIKTTIDPNGGNRIEVKFVGGMFGRVKEIQLVIGPHALATDLHMHLPVIVALKEYQGLTGLERAIVDSVRQRVKGNTIVKPGDPGYRILAETEKLRDLMELRVHELTTARDSARRAKILEDLHGLRDQMTEWQKTVEGDRFDPYSIEMRNTNVTLADKAGSGHVPVASAELVRGLHEALPNRGMSVTPRSSAGIEPLPRDAFAGTNAQLGKSGAKLAPPALDSGQRAVNGTNVVFVHVGEHAGVRLQGAEDRSVIASRNYSSCASISLKGRGANGEMIIQAHLDADPGGSQTQHGQAVALLKNLPPGYEWQVFIHADGTHDESQALKPGQLAQEFPQLPMTISQTQKPGGEEYRSVYTTAEGVVIERFPGGGKGMGTLEFHPWPAPQPAPPAAPPGGGPPGAGRRQPRPRGPLPPPALAPGVFRSPVHERLFKLNDAEFQLRATDVAGANALRESRTLGRRVGDQTDSGAIGAHLATTLPEVLSAAQTHVQAHPEQSIRMLTAEVKNLAGLNEQFGTTGARQVMSTLINELTLSVRLELEGHKTSVSLVYLGGSRVALVVVGPAKPDTVFVAVQRGLSRAKKYADSAELPMLKDPSKKVRVSSIEHPKYPHDPLERGSGIAVVQRAFIDAKTPVERQIEAWGAIRAEQSLRAEAAVKQRNPVPPTHEDSVDVPERIPDVARPEGPRSKFKLRIDAALEAEQARRAAGEPDAPGKVPGALLDESARVLRSADADALGLHAPGALIPMFEDALAWKRKSDRRAKDAAKLQARIEGKTRREAREVAAGVSGESAAVIAYDVRNLGGLGHYLGRDVSPLLYREMVEIITATLQQELPTASLSGCHYGGDEFGFVAVGAFTEMQAKAAHLKATTAVREWAEQQWVRLEGTNEWKRLQEIPHLKAGKRPGTGVTGDVVMIERQKTGRDILESLNAVDRAKAAKKKGKPSGPVPPPALAPGVFRSPVHERLFRLNDAEPQFRERDVEGANALRELRTLDRRLGDQTDSGAIGAHLASTLPEVLSAAQAHAQTHPDQSIRVYTAEVQNLAGLNAEFGTTGARQVMSTLINELTLGVRLELEAYRTSVSLVYLGGSQVALVVVGLARPTMVSAAVQRGLVRAKKYADIAELPLLKDPSQKARVSGIEHPKYPRDPLLRGSGIVIVQRAVIDAHTPIATQLASWEASRAEQWTRVEAARKQRNPKPPKHEAEPEVPEAIPDVARPEGPRSKFTLRIDAALATDSARRAANAPNEPEKLPGALLDEAARVLREVDADALGLHAPGALIPMFEDAIAWRRKRAAESAGAAGESAAVLAYDVRNLGGLGHYLGRDVSPLLYRKMVEIIAATLAQELPTASLSGCHYGGDEFGFLAVGAFTEKQAQAARIKATAAVRAWADQQWVRPAGTSEWRRLQEIPHLKEGKQPGTGVTGDVIMIVAQETGRDVLESLNALDRAKAMAKEATKKGKKGAPPEPGTPAAPTHTNDGDAQAVGGRGRRAVGMQPVGVRVHEPQEPRTGTTDDFPRSGQRQQQQQQQQAGPPTFPHIPDGSLLSHQRPPKGTGRGHPYEHIERTDDDLRRMLDDPRHNRPAATTFVSEKSAHFLVDDTLEARAADIQRWLKGGPSVQQSFILRANRLTGHKIERANRKQVLACDSVVVVLMPDPTLPAGYYILTAYPE